MLSSAYFQRDNLYKRMKPYDFDDSERGTVFNIIQKNNKEFSTLSSKHVDGCYSSNILQRKKNIVCQPTDKTSAAATSNTNNCRYFKTVVSLALLYLLLLILLIIFILIYLLLIRILIYIF